MRVFYPFIGHRYALDRTIIAAIVLSATLWSTKGGGADAGMAIAVLPPGWQPSLADVIEVLEADPPAVPAVSQQALVAEAQRRADLYDAELFLTYVRLSRALDAAARESLTAEQQRWLEERAARAEAAVVSRGGSLAPLEYNEAFVRLTRQREEELRKRSAVLARPRGRD